jgi:hypothetical protein
VGRFPGSQYQNTPVDFDNQDGKAPSSCFEEPSDRQLVSLVLEVAEEVQTEVPEVQEEDFSLLKLSRHQLDPALNQKALVPVWRRR